MKSKTLKKILFFALLVAIALYRQGYFSKVNSSQSDIQKVPVEQSKGYENNSNQRVKAKLDRVVDGDTLVVFLDSKKERLRLIGINSPESTTEHREIECFGNESSSYVKSLLEKGDLLYLEFDPVAGKRDSYNRLLAHVYLEDETLLAEKIISEGYAYEYSYRGQNYLYKSRYKSAQKNAKEKELGLWSKNACPVL